MFLSKGMSVYPNLVLSQWNGVTPVILPIGPQTLSCIAAATSGVAVPFFLFLVAMFYLLIPIWLQNSHSDQPKTQNYEMACENGLNQCTINANDTTKYNMGAPSNFSTGASVLVGEASMADPELMQMSAVNYGGGGVGRRPYY